MPFAERPSRRLSPCGGLAGAGSYYNSDMRRRDFLAAAGAAAQTSRPPNVVFILTDDHGQWAMGCYGNPEIRTPVLDRLAAGGARLTRAFAATPVCSPSRATFLTGKMPCQHGIHDWIREENVGARAVRFLDGHVTFPRVLSRHGYRVGLSGKWHLGDSAAPQQGFSVWFAMPTGGVAKTHQDAEMIWQGRQQVYPGYITDVITRKAIEFIEQSRRDPFFCFVSYNAPHTPYTGTPEKYLALYRDSPLRTFPDEPLNPLNTGLARTHHRKRESMIAYYAMITAVDENVGRIVGKLDQLGLRENTLIVFAADQGFLCGHHGLWGKGNGSWPFNMYEESILIPMIWNHPARIPKAQVLDSMVGSYDFPATLLDYLGLDGMEGASYAPLLLGKKKSWRKVVYGEYQYTRMIRTERWKYIRRTEGFPSELYDLKTDPGERRNVAGDPAQAGRVKELGADLDRWFAARGCGPADAWKQTRQVLPAYKAQGV
jgi:choline-sulfatase